MWCDIIYIYIIKLSTCSVLQCYRYQTWGFGTHEFHFDGVSRCLLIEVASKTTWESIASIFTMPDNALIASLWAMLFMSFSSGEPWCTPSQWSALKCFEAFQWESQAEVCPDWHHRPWYPPIFGGEQRYVGCFRRWNLHRRWQRNVQYIESLAWSFH